MIAANQSFFKETNMSEETIFSKIIKGEIPGDIVYQDELVTAFLDINPQTPVHILIVPNKIIPTVSQSHISEPQKLL